MIQAVSCSKYYIFHSWRGRSITSSILLVIVHLFLLGCQTADREIVKFTILHTNDHHGRFWQNKHGEYGMAARKTLVDQIRQEVAESGGYSLLFSGGDINTGVPESDLLDAEPDFKGMSLLGYDAMALGNHEFDNPISVLKKQQTWANFPFLSANIRDRKTNERLFEPFKIFSVGGIKIAVLGLVTEYTAKIGNPEFIKDIVFTSAIDEARELVPELRKKADLVIAITHMGHDDDGKYADAPGDVSLARAVRGIDMIAGGHSQEVVCMKAANVSVVAYQPGDPCVPDKQNGTIIVQAFEWGKYLGRADFTFIKAGMNSSLELDRYQLIPVNLRTNPSSNEKPLNKWAAERIPENKEMIQLLTPFQQSADKTLYQTIAETNGELIGGTRVARSRPTNLGNLIATAQMEATSADVAVMNSGGIRAGIEQGKVTVKDVLKVQPFNNNVCYVVLSGAELKSYLKFVLAQPKGGGYPQLAGLQRRSPDDWWVTGQKPRKIVAGESYKLAINSFIARGGNGYPNLSHYTGFVETDLKDAKVLQDFIQSKGKLDVNAFSPE